VIAVRGKSATEAEVRSAVSPSPPALSVWERGAWAPPRWRAAPRIVRFCTTIRYWPPIRPSWLTP